MKTQMTSFFLLAVVALLVRAQTPAEPNYEGFISNLKLPLDNYRPLLNEVRVETIHTEDVDSAMSVRSLTFPAQETACSSTQGEQCPLKKNGNLMVCNIKVTYPIHEVNDIKGFEMTCDTATEAASPKGPVRTRRSKAGKGSGRGNGGRGGRGRPGGGSSIANGGNRGNSGTRTA